MNNIKVTIAARNQGDGSVGMMVFGEGMRGKALKWLGRTEEELEAGCPYDDGLIIETELDLEKGTFIELDGI